jgi:serine phosphatase RsbU (regulator of sigma subunit)
LTTDSCVYAEDLGFTRERGEIAEAISGFAEGFPHMDFSFAEWDPAQSGAYFRLGKDLWLIGARVEEPGSSRLWGGRIDRPVLDRLARILHSDVRISFSDTLTLGSGEGEEIRTLSVRSEERPQGIYGLLKPDSDLKSPPSPQESLWNRSLYFGVSSLWMFTYDEGLISKQRVLVFLEGSLKDVAGELAAGRNPLSRFVLILLLVLAILLLILEAFAFVFGLRITTGILSAVRVLHRGTRRLAGGDLDARIEIPNEDELGDLAASFNEMAAAVKKGREEAVIRERLESELETARKIQERLLPHAMPDVPGFEIAGTSLPSQQVGGDYFDFLDMSQGQLGIAIADVSGKGIPAALLMANLQASLHAQVIRPAEVAEVASRINNLLVESTDSNMFATFFYGILDQKRAVFTSCNAGHNPPLLMRREGGIERLKAGGLLLGFMPDQEYAQESMPLKPEDILVLYTDGITEAVDTSLDSMAENLFGEERLIEVIRRHQAGSAREIQSAILAAISEFTEHSPQSDDITLVVIKRRSPGQKH